MSTDARADVLLVTATDVETKAVLESFATSGQPPPADEIDGRVYFNLGTVTGARVRLTQCEMGAGGPGASQQAVNKGIAALSPAAVIMVGIAFGLNERKQGIGDVLVTEQLRLYDLQRVGTHDGEVKIVLRGDKAHAATSLVNLLKSARYSWKGATLRFGPVLTGEKLVDNLDFRAQLHAFEPEAIGGEMEGAGLYVACHDRKVDWILVKAICDWGDGHKGDDKAERQELAAKNAAAFVLHALRFVTVDWDARRGFGRPIVTNREISAPSPSAPKLADHATQPEPRDFHKLAAMTHPVGIFDLTKTEEASAFYAYVVQFINQATTSMYVSGRGFSSDDKEALGRATDIIAAEARALARGCRIIRIQVGTTASLQWMNEYASLLIKYPDKLKVYLDPAASILVNVRLMDPGTAKAMFQLLVESHEMSGGRALARPLLGIIIGGSPDLTRQTQAQFETWINGNLKSASADDLRAPAGARSEDLYFAYGSNLCPDQMLHRCPAARLIGAAALVGWTLTFDVDAPHLGGAAAGIRACVGARVEGVLYAMTPRDRAALDAVEAGGYTPRAVVVQMRDDGAERHAYTYIPIAERAPPPPERQRPPVEYLQKLVRGARQHGLTGLLADLEPLMAALVMERQTGDAHRALSPGGPRVAYLHAMNTAIDGTRLQRFDGSGPVTITSAYVSPSSATGAVTIYYAGPNGAVDDVDVSSANANILGVPLGMITDPIGVLPDCVTLLPLTNDPNFPSPGTPGGASCTNTPIAITYTVKAKASAISGSTRPGTYTTGGSLPISIAEVFTTIASALSAYCLSTGVGGLEQEAGAGVVYRSELENAIRNASPGLYAVSVSLPASATTPIALGCIATVGTITGTLVVVAG